MSPTILDITTLLGTISSNHDRSIDVVLSTLKFDFDLKSIFDEMTQELLKEKDYRRNRPKEDVAKLSKNFLCNTLIYGFADQIDGPI